MSSDFLSQTSNLPGKITKTTDSISKGADKLDSLVDKMSQSVSNWETNNRLTGGLKNAGKTLANGADHLTDFLKDRAKNIENIGNTVSKGITPLATAAGEIKQYSEQLAACKDVVTTSALVVNAIVDSVSGHFHPRAAEQALSKFDGQWDQWAKTINEIYSHLSPSGQTNILESLAKDGFSENVFLLGSAIKNEASGIFGGIADFEDAIHMFRGSYRNPFEAAAKIEKGVKNIVKATERVATSLNSMVKVFQKGKGLPETGNPVLSYLSDLHSNKALSTVNKALTLGGSASTGVSDVSSLTTAIKSKDPSAIYKAGKQTYDDVKKIAKELKTGEGNVVSKSLNGTSTGGAAPVGSSATKENKKEDDNQQKEGTKKIDNGSTDSYVCSGAVMKCTHGSSTAKLTVLPSRTVWLTGQPMANISDHQSFVNLGAFGRCRSLGFPSTASATAANHGHLTPMPCMHNTPLPWMGGKSDYIVKGDPALLKSSKCSCLWGGTISLVTDGQTDGTGKDLDKVDRVDNESLDELSEEKLSVDDFLDGLQMALDAAGLFPGLGAIPDLINACISAGRGDWDNAGLCLLAAVPGIGDVAGAAKLMKNGAKIAQKTKKAQKATKGVTDIATARAKKEAKAQRAKLVEKGVAEGKVVKIETRQNKVIKREASTGNYVEISRPTSISRTETIKASSGNPYEKVTPVTPSKSIGNSTSYGSGNKDCNITSKEMPKAPKEEPLLKMKEQIPEEKVIKIEACKKAKGLEEVKAEIENNESAPKFGV